VEAQHYKHLEENGSQVGVQERFKGSDAGSVDKAELQ